jgi:hypothetical protein
LSLAAQYGHLNESPCDDAAVMGCPSSKDRLFRLERVDCSAG